MEKEQAPLTAEERVFWGDVVVAFVRREKCLPSEAACFADEMVKQRRKRVAVGGGS